MITQIEIDGFKTFRNFKMQFSPLTVIAGTNASGKSNLFDALKLLSRLAETDLKTAFSEQRGEAIELFSQYGEEDYADNMHFVIEMLVDKRIRDAWGGEYELKYTRLRYKLSLCRRKNDRGLEDLFVTNEHLENFKHNEDNWVTSFIPRPQLEDWRPKVSKGKRQKPYIYTENEEVIRLPQDGRQGGKAMPAQAATQTVLSGINSVDFPHAFAAKEEMRRWKFLQLNPEALSQPSPYLAKDTITQSGKNLAAALYRIKINDSYALTEISQRLNNLLPILVDLDIYDDKANKQFVIKVRSEDGREFSSRVLSEGTLRLLTLCVFQYDDHHNGLIGFEEPENGIHPFQVKYMVELLKDLSVDFAKTDTPLRQVIVNTHSPIVVGEMFELNVEKIVTVWFSQLVTQIASINGNKKKLHITKNLPVIWKPQINLFESDFINKPERELTSAEAIKYLQSTDFEKTIESLSQ